MVKIYAVFHTANNRYSGNDRYSGIKSPDRFFHYSGRCLYTYFAEVVLCCVYASLLFIFHEVHTLSQLRQHNGSALFLPIILFAILENTIMDQESGRQ